MKVAVARPVPVAITRVLSATQLVAFPAITSPRTTAPLLEQTGQTLKVDILRDLMTLLVVPLATADPELTLLIITTPVRLPMSFSQEGGLTTLTPQPARMSAVMARRRGINNSLLL
jgi:hypothetical protein